ncbi:MAG: hypothetical protein WB808_04760 [Candidatus Dormiibacterota bacterium]
MSRWIAALTHTGRRPDGIGAHATREQRLEGIRDAVEGFTCSLALLLAGHDAPTEVAGDRVIAQLQRGLRPFLDGGDAMRPDFGAFGDLRIEGELLQSTEPVLAVLEFDDRSTRETARGRLSPARRRRLRIRMHISIDPIRILDCAISDVSDPHG